MKKVILFIILVLLVFPGCFNDQKEEKKEIKEDKETVDAAISYSKILEIEKLLSFLEMKKEEILSELGNDYEIVGSGPEGIYDGYYYKSLGISFTFNEDDTVGWIDCDNVIEIKGAQGGMDFEQIQAKLGKGKIEEGWEETPENKVWSLYYEMGNGKIEFRAFNSSGIDSRLIIHKKIG